jgi:hypothetical protein
MRELEQSDDRDWVRDRILASDDDTLYGLHGGYESRDEGNEGWVRVMAKGLLEVRWMDRWKRRERERDERGKKKGRTRVGER